MLVALMYAWVAHASLLSSSHDPIARADHDRSWQADHHHGHDPDHGHEHDEYDRDPEQASGATHAGDGGIGHAHPHHAADHSHDKPNVPRGDAWFGAPSRHVWAAAPPPAALAAPLFALERPPRSLSTN